MRSRAIAPECWSDNEDVYLEPECFLLWNEYTFVLSWPEDLPSRHGSTHQSMPIIVPSAESPIGGYSRTRLPAPRKDY